jgi:hypothetical protein
MPEKKVTDYLKKNVNALGDEIEELTPDQLFHKLMHLFLMSGDNAGHKVQTHVEWGCTDAKGKG